MAETTSGESPVIAETNATPAAVPDGTVSETPQGAESAPAADTGETPTEPPKRVAWWDKRISELTGEKHSERIAREQAEANAEYWRRYAMENAKPAEQKPDGKPKTLEDFEFDVAKYQAYLVTELVPSLAEQVVQKKLTERDEHDRAQHRQAEWNKRTQDFIKDTPDFLDVVVRNRALPVTAEMAEVIQTSEMGPQVAYYLGKNPIVAQTISQLPPVMQAAELGKIEARLDQERKQVKEPPKVSQAPPPPPTIAASEPGNVEKDPTKMTDAEFRKMRERQIQARKSWRQV
jgi:hypothetical protein